MEREFLKTKIEFIKGIGPGRAETLQKELNIFSTEDMLLTYPFRYVDRTRFDIIKDVYASDDFVQLKGVLTSVNKMKGKNNRSRQVATFKDGSGVLELVWFQGVSWIEQTLVLQQEYIVFGKISVFNGNKTIAHPEMELASQSTKLYNPSFEPVYKSTKKLDSKGIDSRLRRKFIQQIFAEMTPQDLPETLPKYVLEKLKLISRYDAIQAIHFPKSDAEKDKAIQRLKFEEFFYLQMRLLVNKKFRKTKNVAPAFEKVGTYFNDFYQNHLPFELTNAQKKVIKEIRMDVARPVQMNRLLQGDVGSGKTIVALLAMLIALDNGFQACIMAPTEILAQQHYVGIQKMVESMPIQVGFLSGSVKGKKREAVLADLKEGKMHIIVGTHALIEDWVEFQNLGLSIVDEQHRFGVSQRASLWNKAQNQFPHILVMTATPIPRTLAMTVYGDLDVSVIDELPPGRKEIQTLHMYDAKRPQLIEFMRAEIEKGRQIYIVYPLIQESEKLDLQNLNDGYERLLQFFPMPEYQISIVHGKMKAKDKDFEMQRFIQGTTQIMVATTVIEVGVNVPNASVMIIENTERFGLSQLHQLRGRVGRGADQSYCILVSDYKISKDGRERIKTMVSTTNGFEIAEADLKLRGPGDIQGTQQSGLIDFKLLNIITDRPIMDTTRLIAERIIENDPDLAKDIHEPIRSHVAKLRKIHKDWGRIS